MPEPFDHHVLTFADDAFALVGPFPDQAAVRRWGAAWAARRAGDPRWTSVRAPADVRVPVLAPLADGVAAAPQPEPAPAAPRGWIALALAEGGVVHLRAAAVSAIEGSVVCVSDLTLISGDILYVHHTHDEVLARLAAAERGGA